MSIEQGIPKSHNPHQIAVLGDLMTEVRDEVVAGSNPVIPTIERKAQKQLNYAVSELFVISYFQ